MKLKIYTISFLLGFASLGFSQQAEELFISEYCEYNQNASTPAYYNHYIEIYNGTGDTVDMSNYQLWRSYNATDWNNNNGTPEDPLSLNGKLANYQTYVITRPNDTDKPNTLSSYASQTWSFLNISGDDAIGLAKSDGNGSFVLIDLIGSETVDPGNGWSVSGIDNATQNHTLIRKSNQLAPTTDWDLSKGTNTEDSQWIVLDENDISNIGIHSFDGADNPESSIDTLTALFIGNSYTYYNELPKLVNSIANTNNKVLIHNQSTPGGYSLEEHSTNAATLSYLRAKSYDYMILQDQSQRPTKPIEQVEENTFQYARFLDSLRRLYSPCGQTMFYMTWGRKNGDSKNCSTIPEVCTYEGMDSLLRLRYIMMQEQNDALISPVGALWHYVRDHHPEIELYDADESHPSAAGSFVSATSFYTAMFKDNPLNTSYNFSLSDSVAQLIRVAAKAVVYDSLDYWNTYKPGCANSMEISVIKPTPTDTIYVGVPFEIAVEIQTEQATIEKVEFYLNNELLEEFNTAPFEMETLSNKFGSNTIMIRAFDTDSNIVITRKTVSLKNQPSGLSNSLANSLKVYPNPCRSYLNIESTELKLPAEINIYNQVGQLVLTDILRNKQHRTELTNFQNGFYMVEIKSLGQTSRKAIIKQ